MVAPAKMAGLVVSAGKMMKTVKVELVTQKFQPKLKKNFTFTKNVLVHDANSTVVEGDVITLTPERHARHVRHAVQDIIAPFGKPLTERPPLLTPEERQALITEAKAQKAQRRVQRERERVAMEERRTIEKAAAKLAPKKVTESGARTPAQRRSDYLAKLKLEREKKAARKHGQTKSSR